MLARSLISALIPLTISLEVMICEAAVKQNPGPIKVPADTKTRTEIELEALATRNIFVGDVQTLLLPSIKRIAVGNGKVLNAAAVSAREILVIAESAGNSALSIWDKTGKEHKISFRVHDENTSKSLKDLASLLNDIPNIEIRMVGDKVVVEGQNVSNAVQVKLDMLARQFPSLVNMTNPVTWEKMVHIDVRIVEFNKQALRELGIRWSTSIQGPSAGYGREWVHNRFYRVGDTSDVTPITDKSFQQALDGNYGYFGIVTALTSQIDLMAKDGRAVILAEPRLSTRSGSDAHFLAGGEIPLPVRGDNGEINVFYKEYGIVLDIRPEAGGDGTIRASVKAEVSSIDPSVAVGGFPGFLKRQTNTEVNLKENETLVISGLVSTEMGKEISKIPLLGDIPVIGQLFTSKNFRNRQTELVFFVTPRIVLADSDANRRIANESQKHLDEASKSLSIPGEK